jgi:rod shape-determining protein MreC
VRVGDTVLTSGLGGRFPPDLLLGRVSQVSGSAQDLYRDIEIEPEVRLSTVETVLVLTSYVPAGGP